MIGERRTLAGRYRLADVIGAGGMSTVYRASDLVLDRTVAVKVMSRGLSDGGPSFATRFEREARAAASLTHSSVVTVYDAGEDDGVRFIAMEYVDGRTLAEILREEAPLEPARAMTIAERIASALAAAHATGIVHRDVKPGNVMVTPDGTVKVLDFGIARALDGTALTQTNSLLGTAAYIAPEHALGERADERADIYSLGCVLYAMLTGRPPFTNEIAAAVISQHVNEPPRPLRDLRREIPPALDALVMQMLAKSPEARPQTALEVRSRLRSLLAGSPVDGRALPPTVAATAPTAPMATGALAGPLAATASTRPLVRRNLAARRRRIATIVLAAAAALVAVVALAASGTSGPAASSTSRTSSQVIAPTTTAHSTTTAQSTPTTTAAAPPPAPAPPKHHHKRPGHDKKHGKHGGG